MPSLSYKDSGVDIDAGDDLVQRIKPLSRGTHRAGAVGGLGGFGGLFRLNEVWASVCCCPFCWLPLQICISFSWITKIPSFVSPPMVWAQKSSWP